jgi:hypothetical protein
VFIEKPGHKAIAIFCALLSCAGALAWMGAIAHFDYGGNWTAFYRTGSGIRLPPIATQENVYLLQGAGSGGYDGQYYRLIAQDPLIRHGTARFIDAPRLRYRRILVPALAWVSALGNPKRATYTYIAIVIVFLGLGTYWLSSYAARVRLSPWWGLAFLLAPAAFLSIDRLTVDIALAALTVAFALYWQDGPVWKLYLVLLFAPLAKETGIFYLAAYCLYVVFQRRAVHGLCMATAGIPAVVWFLYVQFHTANYGTAWIELPFQAVLQAMFHPELYASRKRFVVPLDYLAWFGMILAIAMALRCWKNNNPLTQAAVFFAALAATIDLNVWQEVEGFGRAFTPLLILLPMVRSNRLSLLPLLLMLPRAVVFPVSETFSAFLYWIG